MNLDNVVLVTHKNCIDGSTCALVFLAAGGKKKNIIFSSPNHEETDEKIIELLETHEDSIIIADLSISLKIAQQIPLYRKIYLLDHHKSAIPLTQFSWCEIEKNNLRAGGKMLYDFLIDNCNCSQILNLNKYKDLVNAADDYDRWIKTIPESDILASLHNILGQKLFIERFEKNSSLKLKEKEKFLLEIESYKEKEYVANAKKNLLIQEKNINNKIIRIAYVLANKHQNSIGHAIYEDLNLNVDAVFMIGNKTISMRGNGKLDLSLVAKKLGGGGHQKSAGCSLNKVLDKDLLNIIMEKFNEKISFNII